MSYEPLHHKYRPQTFADLVGQEAIATTLTNAISKNQIAPAYLFTGSRGTGKTSSARILAKSLNCLASPVPTDKPCGKCEACQGIAKGVALDVIEIDAASNTGVDNIREIIERAQFAPVQCRYKVYAIDECHMLSGAAFNCLLKTLEEPPNRVVFILATTDPQRVLPTIISRCQRFDFRRIPLEAMVGHLSYIAKQESIDIAADALRLVAQVAQGGLRDAESLLDQLSLLSGQITAPRVWDLLGSVSEQDSIELLNAIAQNNLEAIVDCTRKIMDRGKEPLVLLQNLASFYRDLLIAKTAPSRSDLVALTPPTWQALCELAQSWEISDILAGQQHLAKSEVQIKNTTQPRLWLEVTLLGLLSTANSTPVAPPKAINHNPPVPKPSFIPPAPVSEPKFEQVPPPTPPQPVQQLTPPAEEEKPLPASAEADTDLWQQVVKQIQPFSNQALFGQHCRLLSFADGVAQIGITSQPLLKLAQGKLASVEAAFGKLLQQKVRVTLEIVEHESKTASNKENGRSPAAKFPPISQPSPAPQSPPVSQPSPVVKPQPLPSQREAAVSPIIDSVPPEALRIEVVEPITDPVKEANEDELAIASSRLAEIFKGEVVESGSTSSITSRTKTSTQEPPLIIPPQQWNETDEDLEEDF
ncbi:DNA polymerase III subunit gamma/tau [Aliterella atlantica]|uniref:DNA polymerase III subunit gamma/tau n=1 Tax=Aliterella atlantica CENA595 TaxID=1618023 RepID=A0A0D8ZQL8_9CYAN|nr:DNA polymerase III subunit gamma/tau [Aliterella atlantica]KJH71108.1 DNA polymerase III subunit gamma/tau [Aliterella atlantica CENA595]